jgi:UDP-N-acetyl-2-amino-2-deoxyglucuronate dehydrogenase
LTNSAGALGVAVIGAGEISGYHLAALREVPNARIVAVTSRNLAKAERLADEYGAAHAYDDWRRVLERADVDAVIVATPDDTHREITIAAVDAGRAVLVQKPVAPTADDARAIAAAADRAGVLVAVSFMHRHFAEVVRLRELLTQGALGRILTVRLRNATPGPDWGAWFYAAPPVGRGGVVGQLGIHGIDLVQHLFGPIEAVTGRLAALLSERRLRDGATVPNQVCDHAAAVYELAGGTLVSHEMSWAEVAGTDRFRLEVYGTKGTAWLRSPTRGLAVAFAGDDWTDMDLPEISPGLHQHEEFVEQVLGVRPPDGTLRDAIAGIEVMEALYAAADTGRRVVVHAGR